MEGKAVGAFLRHLQVRMLRQLYEEQHLGEEHRMVVWVARDRAVVAEGEDPSDDSPANEVADPLVVGVGENELHIFRKDMAHNLCLRGCLYGGQESG